MPTVVHTFSQKTHTPSLLLAYLPFRICVVETRNLRCQGSFIDYQTLAYFITVLYNFIALLDRHAFIIFLILPLNCVFKGKNCISCSVRISAYRKRSNAVWWLQREKGSSAGKVSGSGLDCKL